MFKEKYTMDEFEDMFIKAQKETIKELTEDMEEHLKDNEDEEQTAGMNIAFMMQNILVTAKLHQKLFGKEEE